jgi:hypothetical protein
MIASNRLDVDSIHPNQIFFEELIAHYQSDVAKLRDQGGAGCSGQNN